MRRFRSIIIGFLMLLLAACAALQPGESTMMRPAIDRLLTSGDIQVAEQHLRDFGFDPGPVGGVFTPQTQAAVRAFQARYGLPVSGLIDWATRQELLPGMDDWKYEGD
jgi:peptidoglycan hydrolase-like protein with peptidoglycan-binding domain